jgi:hypothetical protein
MAKYLSQRQRVLNVGVVSYTESDTTLSVVGKVGIGTTNAFADLDVIGDARIRGALYDFNNSAGQNTYVPVASGGGWSWQPITQAGAGTIDGIVIREEGTIVGTAGSVTNLDFRGSNITATSVTGGAIATITVSDTPSFLSLEVTNGSVLNGELQVNNNSIFTGNVSIAGNLSIGGTTTVLVAEDLFVIDKTIVLGITTNNINADVSTDTSANGGGISIASTEGNPLVSLQVVGVNTLPNTHKKLLWARAGTYGVGTTDAWLFNYAVGIGSTLVPNNVGTCCKVKFSH